MLTISYWYISKSSYMIVCLFVCYGISTFVGYLMPNPFYSNKYFYFKQFHLGKVHSLIVKKHFYFKLFSFVKQF